MEKIAEPPPIQDTRPEVDSPEWHAELEKLNRLTVEMYRNAPMMTDAELDAALDQAREEIFRETYGEDFYQEMKRLWEEIHMKRAS